MTENHSKLEAFYTDIIEEPLIAGRFLVYSGPTVLLLLDGKEVCRASGFIVIVELERMVDKLEEVCDLCHYSSLSSTTQNLLSHAKILEDVLQSFVGSDGATSDVAKVGESDAEVFRKEVGVELVLESVDDAR